MFVNPFSNAHFLRAILCLRDVSSRTIKVSPPIKTMRDSFSPNVQQQNMALTHQARCFGFVLLLCLFTSTFARRLLKDLPMMAPIKLDLIHPANPGMVSLSAQDHDLFGLEPEPDHQPLTMDLEDKVKPNHKVKPDYKEKLDDKEKIDHVVKPAYKEMLDDKEKIDHVVKPAYKEMLDDKEKIDHVVKPDHKVESMASELEDSDHTVKPMGYGVGRGYGSGNGVGYGIGYGSGGSGFGEGIGSSGGSGFGEGIGSGGGTGIGIGEGSGSGQPNCGPGSGGVVVPGTTIPPIVVPGTQIPGFVIPGVTVPGYGSGCQTGGCAPYYHPPTYQPPTYQPPNCPHCPPFTSGQDKHMSDKGTMTEALAPASSEMHV